MAFPLSSDVEMPLLLEYAADAVPAEGFVVVRSLSALTLSYGKDAAGHIFHEHALRQRGLLRDPTPPSSPRSLSDDVSASASAPDLASLDKETAAPKKAAGGGKKKKTSRRDLYALLGLQEERWLASQDAIRLAYRKTALQYHPDKMAKAGLSEREQAKAEERFKAIQAAYETLSDPAKRKEFDATDEFDDSCPDVDELSPEEFFAALGPVFKRNARWSTVQPVPDLGDDDTPFDKVDAFYSFWARFKSWRDFPHEDEEDTEGAEGREHKRWIERNNAKLREPARKAEARRIRALAEAAERNDPRLARRREARRAEKEAKQAEKQREKREKEERERKEREEAEAAKAREAEDQAASKKRRANERKALQKERARLRRLAASARAQVAEAAARAALAAHDEHADPNAADEHHIDQAAGALALDEMRGLCDELDALGLAVAEEEAVAEAQGDEARHARLAAALHLLASARRAAAKEADAAAEARAAEAREVAKRSRAAAAHAAAARRKALEAWTEDEVRVLRKALERFPVGTPKRWEAVQAAVRTRTVEEVVEMVKHGLKSATIAKAHDATGTYRAPKNVDIKAQADTRDVAFTDVQIDDKKKQENRDAEKEKEDTQAAATAPATPTPAAAAAAPPALGWTEAQERALILALKAIPKDVPDRWTAVAKQVPGKSKTECFMRFKAMKMAHKVSKAGGKK